MDVVQLAHVLSNCTKDLRQGMKGRLRSMKRLPFVFAFIALMSTALVRGQGQGACATLGVNCSHPSTQQHPNSGGNSGGNTGNTGGGSTNNNGGGNSGNTV